MLSLYSRLLADFPERIAESSYPYLTLTERHIQVMWLEQKYFKDLKTSDGEDIVIIHPGIWNLEAGPDFKKAKIKIGTRICEGDIEIHLSDEGWYQHRHHLDVRYNEVILHLSFWKAKQPKELFNQKEARLLQAYLESSTTIPINRILKLIDLELYPYKKFIGSGHCAKEVFYLMPADKIKDFFTSAADWRLMQKNEQLKLKIDSPSLRVEAGLATVLGYKQNSDAFFELYIHLNKYRYLEETSLLAMGLGILGFFSVSYFKKWQANPYYIELKRHYEELFEQSLISISLQLNSTRPLNHPIRRVVYLCKILKKAALDFKEFELTWAGMWVDAAKSKKWNKVKEAMFAKIPHFEDDYWCHHYLFESQASLSKLNLLGDDLRTKFLVNIVFPMLHEQILHHQNPEELKALHQYYRTLPSEKSGKERYLAHRFFGSTEKSLLLNKAPLAQGAMQLHRDFCLHYEASCEGCPFIDRFEKNSSA